MSRRGAEERHERFAAGTERRRAVPDGWAWWVRVARVPGGGLLAITFRDFWGSGDGFRSLRWGGARWWGAAGCGGAKGLVTLMSKSSGMRGIREGPRGSKGRGSRWPEGGVRRLSRPSPAAITVCVRLPGRGPAFAHG
ncbi:hypothetical protein GCM10027168_72880 [Streptomyces capparidis]